MPRIDVGSWVVLTSPDPEDGERRERLIYHVVATFDDGRRFIHAETYTTADAADLLATKIAAAVRAGRVLKLDEHWNETDPAYGSAQWQAADAAGDWLEREREDDRNPGMVHHGHGGWRWAS